MKKIAILQSNYIPWKGYFDLINSVDDFVLLDDAQFTRRDWRNRNRIKTPAGLKWLTIPIKVKGLYFQKIGDALVADESWAKKHWEIIKQSYSKAPYFGEFKGRFEELYLGAAETSLSLINYKFIQAINSILGITTRISWSREYNVEGEKVERLIGICKKLEASEYISGPAGKDYISGEMFDKEGIKLTWMDYSGYSQYLQLYPPFEHKVSIIDLIFSEGPNAKKYMKSYKNSP